ncbi:uncharacterized protein [Rutidosis leptorrhynchoides]|uniref:uncharacterized protein n=1 Tax=Rutidosis leptorrhynchoides TaxID=125765 RepID=UPI003A99E2A1
MWNTRLVAPTLVPPAITKPPIGADNRKIEGNFFTMIKDMLFHGLIDENPFEHIQQFNDICDIYKNKDVCDDVFKLRAFPFTLQREAKIWLRNLPSDSIRSFQDLTDAFIKHFFLPSKVERLRMGINGFTQRSDETLYDAWVCFKKMLRACPPHGLSKKEYINTFYRGTNALTKQYLHSSSGGQQIRNQQTSFQNFESTVGRLSNQVVERPQGTLPLNTQVNPKNNRNNQHSQQNQQNNNTRVIPIESNTPSQHNNQASSSNPNNNYAQVNSIASIEEEDQTDCPHVFTFDVEEDKFEFNETLEIDTMDFGVFTFLNDSEEAKKGLNAKKQKNEVEVYATSIKEKNETPVSHPQPLPPTHLKDVNCKSTLPDNENIYIKLPLAEVLENMPNYGKFLKTLMAKKGDVEQSSTTFLKKECDEILKKCNLPTKMGDRRPFLIPCNVNGSEMFTSLADSGANINFMPYSI